MNNMILQEDRSSGVVATRTTCVPVRGAGPRERVQDDGLSVAATLPQQHTSIYVVHSTYRI